MVAARPRIYERVPSLIIGLLAAKGLLPLMPPDVLAIESADRRPLTGAEGYALTWTVLWRSLPTVADLAPVDAVAGWRDTFDHHSQTDVREIVHIAGPATVLLIASLAAEARYEGRRLIGLVNLKNARMNRALRRAGFKATRMMWEA